MNKLLAVITEGNVTFIADETTGSEHLAELIEKFNPAFDPDAADDYDCTYQVLVLIEARETKEEDIKAVLHLGSLFDDGLDDIDNVHWQGVVFAALTEKLKDKNEE